MYKISGRNRTPKYKNPAIRPTPANPSMTNTGQQQHPRLCLRGRAERITDLAPLPTPRSRRPQSRPAPRCLLKECRKPWYVYPVQLIVSLLNFQQSDVHC
jgi:hypothetical protein